MSNISNTDGGNGRDHLPPPLCGLVLPDRRGRHAVSAEAPADFPNEHIARLYNLLDAHCEFAFIAGEWRRADVPGPTPYPIILNPFPEQNPLQDVLVAMQTHPEAAWLVTCAEMRHLDAKTIAHLIVNRNPDKWITAYVKPSDNTPQGLCAIYEPKARSALSQMLADGCSSLDDALAQAADHVEFLSPLDPSTLEIIN